MLPKQFQLIITIVVIIICLIILYFLYNWWENKINVNNEIKSNRYIKSNSYTNLKENVVDTPTTAPTSIIISISHPTLGRLQNNNNNTALTFSTSGPATYFLVNNDLQYKITMMDVSPNTKKNNFISYEPGKRIDWSKLSEITPHNINIICAENMKTIGTSNYYMWYYIIYLITLSFLFYYIYKKGGMKKIKKFYKNIFH